jgi:hypothetical protein
MSGIGVSVPARRANRLLVDAVIECFAVYESVNGPARIVCTCQIVGLLLGAKRTSPVRHDRLVRSKMTQSEHGLVSRVAAFARLVR